MTTSKSLVIGLWVAQVLLGGMFLMVGWMKIATPDAQLTAMLQGNIALPLARFIGWSEFLGGVGVLLPALTRVMPILTPVAAVGLTIVMVLATGFNLTHAQASQAPVTVLLGCLAAFVAWGRFGKGKQPARVGV